MWMSYVLKITELTKSFAAYQLDYLIYIPVFTYNGPVQPNRTRKIVHTSHPISKNYFLPSIYFRP